MPVNVSDLEGVALDYWAARALGAVQAPTREGERAAIEQNHTALGLYLEIWLSPANLPLDRVCRAHVSDNATGKKRRPWSPSTSWADGGPIIARERIGLLPDADQWTAAVWPAMSNVSSQPMPGATPLIAAMRAFVSAKLGEEVPDA